MRYNQSIHDSQCISRNILHEYRDSSYLSVTLFSTYFVRRCYIQSDEVNRVISDLENKSSGFVELHRFEKAFAALTVAVPACLILPNDHAIESYTVCLNDIRRPIDHMWIQK